MDLGILQRVVRFTNQSFGNFEADHPNHRIMNTGRGSKYFIDANSSVPSVIQPVFVSSNANLAAKTWNMSDKNELNKAVNSIKVNQTLNESSSDNFPPNIEASHINWDAISSKISKWSPIECLMQFRNVEDPSINKMPWSREEELKLIEISKKYGEHDWAGISEELSTNRTPIQCLKHFQQVLNTQLVRQDYWTEEEDAILRQAVQIYGTKNWQHVSSTLPGRVAEQCLFRYLKTVKEGLRNGIWSDEEERRLVLATLAYPVPYPSNPMMSLPATPPEQSSLPAPVTLTENDNNMIPSLSTTPAATPSSGTGYDRSKTARSSYCWAQLAYLIPGRFVHSSRLFSYFPSFAQDYTKCREKWMNVLDPLIDRSPFRPEEDALILEQSSLSHSPSSTLEPPSVVEVEEGRTEEGSSGRVSTAGGISWSRIAAMLPGRTDNQVWQRWKKIKDRNDVRCYESMSRKKRRLTPFQLGRKKRCKASLHEDDFELALCSGSGSGSGNATSTMPIPPPPASADDRKESAALSQEEEQYDEPFEIYDI